MAGNSAIPGYGASHAHREAHAGLPLSRFLGLGCFVLLGALEEGLLREPAAYLLPGTSPSLNVCRALALGSFALTAFFARLWHADYRALSWGLGGLSSALALAGPAWFLSFSAGRWAPAASLLPIAIAASSGLVVMATSHALGAAARALDVLRYAAQPFRALLALAALLGCSALGTSLGLWRGAALLAACAALLGLYLPTLSRYLHGSSGSRPSYAPAALGLSAALASFGLALYCVPSTDLGRYPGEIVFTSHGPGQYVVSSVQQSFEVYRGTVLRIASVDAKRYAECLVQPALALARHRSRVLVLGPGDGLAEREVLAYPDVTHVTTISDDLALAKLTRKNAFFGEASAGSLASPRLTLIEAEALPWLVAHPAHFDVIVVDLPDPSDFGQGKNYTHYFYEELGAHLAPDGIFVTQAASDAATPATFSSIAETVASAGFRIQTYAAPIPTLGEWGFVLGSLTELPTRDPSPVVTRVLQHTQFVDARTLELLLSAPPAVDAHAPVNTLSEQPVVDLLNDERRVRGL
jgi:spermidine synthase